MPDQSNRSIQTVLRADSDVMTISKSRKSKHKKKPLLLPSRVADQIGVPISEWPGNCHYIACRMLDKGVVQGESRYGHWRGPIDPGSVFRRDRPITHHGWIAANQDGQEIVIDPTRWVFENCYPYIYQAPDFEGWYDTGGNVFRDEHTVPFPEGNAEHGVYRLPSQIRQLLQRLTGQELDVACPSRLGWLANQSLNRLGSDARFVFQWLVRKKMGALIPLDNRKIVLGSTIQRSSTVTQLSE